MEYSYIIQTNTIQQGSEIPPVAQPVIQQPMASLSKNDKKKKVKSVLEELQLGRRIQMELKEQGRSVTWLAEQLCMERTSLYYIFRQKSIDLELLLRISVCLDYNFLQDVVDKYKDCGLLPVSPFVVK